MASKGQIVGIDWSRIARLHSHVLGSYELTNSAMLMQSTRLASLQGRQVRLSSFQCIYVIKKRNLGLDWIEMATRFAQIHNSI